LSEPARSAPAPAVAHIDDARARREKSEWRRWAKTLRQHYPTLGKPAIALGILLADYAGADGYCYPKHKTLAKQLGYTPRTITNAARQLYLAGAIYYEPGDGDKTSELGRQTSEFWLIPHHLAPPFWFMLMAASRSTRGGTACYLGANDALETTAPPFHPPASSGSTPLGSTSGGSRGSSIDPPSLPPKQAPPASRPAVQSVSFKSADCPDVNDSHLSGSARPPLASQAGWLAAGAGGDDHVPRPNGTEERKAAYSGQWLEIRKALAGGRETSVVGSLLETPAIDDVGATQLELEL
jgi:hypothetical protein